MSTDGLTNEANVSFAELIALTPKEERAAELVAKGWTNKQIAQQMDITPRRVLILISAVAYKTHCDSSKDDRVQVALWWHATHNSPGSHSA